MPRKKSPTEPTVQPTDDAIDAAIAAGKQLIADGQTKMDAALKIYEMLEGSSQDEIVSAFIEGAALTPKGALTYWYNCRRRLTRLRKEQAAPNE